MEPNIRLLLMDMLHQIRQVDMTALNPQQATFINHIEKTTQVLVDEFVLLIPLEHIYIQVLPILKKQLLHPLITIYGYAKLLLDDPSAFSGATIPTHQRSFLDKIYQTGRELEAYIESLQQKEFEYRLEARRLPIESVDLIAFIDMNQSIYRYCIHHTNVQLKLSFTHPNIYITSKPYHVNELIKHIITVIATEFIDKGEIILSARVTRQAELYIHITNLHFDVLHWETLFETDGRHIYYQNIRSMSGNIFINNNTEKGSAIVIYFPLRYNPNLI